MKVLIIHTQYKNKGGEDAVLLNEAALLQEGGVGVEIFYFKNEGGKWNTLVKFLSATFNFRSFFLINKKLKNYKPDIVHLHNWHFAASPSILWAAYLRKIPVVHTLHNFRIICPSATCFANGKLINNSFHESFAWTAIRKKAYRNSYVQTAWTAFVIWTNRKIGTWKRISKFIALNDFQRELILKSPLRLHPLQITVKPNFIKYIPLSSESNRHLSDALYVGRLTEEKGLRTLLRAFQHLQKEIAILGTGDLEKEVVDSSSHHSNISFLGFCSQDEIFARMKSADVLIFPSLWYEGMPMTIIEAFACSLPVIASNLGAMSTMIVEGYNGFHFEAGNPQALTDAVRRWDHLTMPEKNLMRVNARKTYQEQYTPEKNFTQLLGIYQSVLNPVHI